MIWLLLKIFGITLFMAGLIVLLVAALILIGELL